MDWQPRRALIRSADTELHWVEAGQGPPLVLLHGLSDSHRTWSRVAPLLAKNFRLLMPDLPGHGYSDRPDASYSLAWHARAVTAWMESMGIGQADVVGHSYGGGVAQWMLLHARDRVRRMGLVAAGGLGRAVHWALRLATVPQVLERVGQPFMGAGTRVALKVMSAKFEGEDERTLSRMNALPGSARALARTARDVIGLAGQTRNFFDRAHEVPELPPIALFWGTKDGLVPFEHAEAFADRVEGVSVTRFDRCGHFPHRERPEAFARALSDFLTAPALPPARIRPTPPARLSPRRAIARVLGALPGR